MASLAFGMYGKCAMKNVRQTVQAVACGVPRHSIRECHKFAASLLAALKSSGIHARIVRLTAQGGCGFIVPKNPALLLPFKVSLEMAIATNSRHWGVLVEDHVYDQLLPGGVLLEEWPRQYDCDTHHFSVDVVANFDVE